MKKWILKAIIQKTISILPFSFQINYLFQKYVTKAMILSDDFLDDLIRHSGIAVKESNAHWKDGLENKKVLELGTGWHVIAPICMFLCGATKIVTIDLNPHIRRENLLILLQRLKEYKADGRLDKALPSILEDRWSKLESISDQLSMQEILDELNIEQHIGDITKLPLKDDYFDLCYSVNVLEHIYPQVLVPIMHSIFKMTAKGGINYHSLGCYDHYYHVDQSISKFHYLKYSEKQWKLANNDIQPQNRWRVNQFEELYAECGFDTLKNLSSEPNLKELDRLPKVHSDFSHLTREVLAVDYGTHILAKS